MSCLSSLFSSLSVFESLDSSLHRHIDLTQTAQKREGWGKGTQGGDPCEFCFLVVPAPLALTPTKLDTRVITPQQWEGSTSGKYVEGFIAILLPGHCWRDVGCMCVARCGFGVYAHDVHDAIDDLLGHAPIAQVHRCQHAAGVLCTSALLDRSVCFRGCIRLSAILQE
jgi:hypothetical protein